MCILVNKTLNINISGMNRIQITNFARSNNILMMKKLFFAALAFMASQAAFAQCNELFISEYVEGSGNNKALELYNPSNSPIDLGNYRLIRWDNGAVIPSDNAIQVLPAGVFIAPKATYVIALNLTDPNGTGQTAPIDVALQAKADTLLSNGCGTEPGNIRTMCFNGDDALSLDKLVDGNWVKVDIFACIGEQPTNSSGTANPTAAWTDLAPYSSMPVGYTTAEFGPYFMRYWTQNQTLVRKATVTSGVSVNPAPQTFNPSAEWDSIPENTFDSLGFHSCVCNIVGINDVESALNTQLFPNPANHVFMVRSALPVKEVDVYSMVGHLVASKSNSQINFELMMNTEALPIGIYTVMIHHENGMTSTKKLIIKH